MTTRMSVTMLALPGVASEKHRDGVMGTVSKAIKLPDQVRRRILQGETIPHEEKLFSVFRPHTRWISKGKAGRPAKLGVTVTIVEESIGFVMSWQLHWEGGDLDAAVSVLACNLHRLGCLLQKKAEAKRHRLRERLAKAA